MVSTNFIQTILVTVAAIIFFVFIFLGISTGRNSAISNAVISNTQQLALGFKYFKADQDRYPSEFEYSNQDLMGLYFSVFPPANIPTQACPQNFDYKAPDTKAYILNFCLPKASQGFLQGWNKLPSPSLLE